MKYGKKLRFIAREEGVDYYLFTPSIFRLYYDDGQKEFWPKHRKTLKHKLHMLFYVLTGKYQILYMVKSEKVISYFIYTKASKIVQGSTIDDYYTIFYYTYPEYRDKGYGMKITNFVLNKLSLEYKNWFKTIDKDNIASIRVAEKSGFINVSEANRKGIMRKIIPSKKGMKYLYLYSKDKKID